MGRSTPAKAEKKPGPETRLLRLQRSAGNAAVASILVQLAPAAGAKKEARTAHKTLREGDQGPEVEKLQEDLFIWLQSRMQDVDAAGAGFPEAGKFDLNTRLLVMYFQKTLKKPETGVIDPETWAQLETADVKAEVWDFGQGNQSFEAYDWDRALAYYMLSASHPRTPRAGALATFRMAACYHHMRLYDKAVQFYGEALTHPGANDRIQGAATENQDLARAGKEPEEPRAIDTMIVEEIISEYNELKTPSPKGS